MKTDESVGRWLLGAWLFGIYLGVDANAVETWNAIKAIAYRLSEVL